MLCTNHLVWVGGTLVGVRRSVLRAEPQKIVTAVPTNLVRPRPFNGIARIEVQAVGRSHPVTVGVELVDERLASGGAHLSNGSRRDCVTN